MNYSKLVRDSIPDHLQKAGLQCSWEIMNEPEYQQALREKLVEEAQEAKKAGEQELVAELADLYEVIEALMKAYAISPESVRETQKTKRHERGGFERRIRLLWVDEENDSA